jgi:hypothetical protein
MFFGEEARGAVEGFVSGVEKVIARFKADPTKILELESGIAQETIKFQTSVIQSVNATMQAEARSEHWAQWLWRPCFGFTACAVLINNYVLLPYLKPFGVQVIEIPSEVWIMIMAVLGVAAWTRGQEKIQRA